MLLVPELGGGGGEEGREEDVDNWREGGRERWKVEIMSNYSPRKI